MGYRKPLRNKRATLEDAVQTLRPVRLVVAEDDREMRVLVAEALRRDGYQVLEATNGSELVDLLGSAVLRGHDLEPIDLIISDIRMPGWNGLAVLRHLRRADWAMPFILITAYGDNDTHQEAKRLGAVAVFDKPFDIDDLRTLVLNVMPPN
jgi:CheY-like chemotaxis protein